MATKTTSLFLFLAISILSLFTGETLATLMNPRTIPSCRGKTNFPKCYEYYKATYGYAAATEFKIAYDTKSHAVIMVFNAKASCSSALAFFKLMKHGPHWKTAVACESTFTVAIQYLDYASIVMQKDVALTKSQVVEVWKSLTIAMQNVMKCTKSFGPKNQMTILDLTVNLCNIAFKACKVIPVIN